MEEQKINVIVQETDTRVNYVNEIVDKVVSSYTEALDNIMCGIHDEIVSVEYPTTELLEKYFLELTNCLYFISSRTEKLGLYEGISKAATQEVYNKTYLEHQKSNDGVPGTKKPTVAESSAVAENEALYNSIVNETYSAAYKIVKNKISAANTMVSTISKTLSRRMSEYSLTNTQSSTRILNEEL